MSAEVLAKMISSKVYYDFDECKAFFDLAGMTEDWDAMIADGVVPAEVPEEIEMMGLTREDDHMEKISRQQYFRMWCDGNICLEGLRIPTWDETRFEDALFDAADRLGVEIH